MVVLLTVLHVVVAVFLILVVLLQTGKGAEIGASFGGASNTLFGSSGPANFMAKLTTAAAVIFMVTSLSLAWISVRQPLARAVPQTPAPASIPAPGTQGAAGQSAPSATP